MRPIPLMLGGLLFAVLAQIVASLLVGSAIDTTSASGQRTLSAWRGIALFGAWAAFAGGVALTARSSRHPWWKWFLWSAVLSLAALVVTITVELP